MWKKLLSKLGVGAAKVDLVLHHPRVRVGEQLKGEFLIEGGTVEQHIRKLEVELQLMVQADGKAYQRTVAVIPVSSSFTIHPGERKALPFSYVLPLHLPITRPRVRYAFVTRLDIADGVDAFDQDAIDILPPLPLEKLFHALGNIGFREKPSSGKITAYGQEFAFFPTKEWMGVVEEVEFSAQIEENGIRLYLEVDVRSGFGGFHETELKREIFFSNEEIENVEEMPGKLRAVIGEMIQQPRSYVGPSHVPYSSYPSQHVSHHHGGHGMMGAIGGFAAGMLAGMVAEELLEDVVEDALDDGIEDVMDDIGDWFDGGDDIL
ncbi:sporulation protein [Parageobacillus thermoglucosidasius]|uniref:Sporulation protein n=1 Tax=Parageobacillus thermoglucosidasius TaxID=1426 RepID=A0AB38QYK5_PARTM|nr:sporulation protein [Parageobacillus thermoglucosidasius]UOE76185.1 sporulation protein [Parageobacillus thermoglucosidasius]